MILIISNGNLAIENAFECFPDTLKNIRFQFKLHTDKVDILCFYLR